MYNRRIPVAPIYKSYPVYAALTGNQGKLFTCRVSDS